MPAVVMATTVRRIKQEMKIRRSLSMTPSKSAFSSLVSNPWCDLVK